LPLRSPPLSPLSPYTTLFRSLSLLTPLILERLEARGLHVSRLRFVVGVPALPRRPRALVAPKPRALPTGLAERLERLEDDKLRRSEEHTSELQSRENLVCRLL